MGLRRFVDDLTAEGDETFELVILNAGSNVMGKTTFLVMDTSKTLFNVIDASAGCDFPGTNNADRIDGGDKARFVSAGGGDDLIIDSTQTVGSVMQVKIRWRVTLVKTGFKGKMEMISSS